MKVEIERLEPYPEFKLTFAMSEIGQLIGWLNGLPEGKVALRLNNYLVELETGSHRRNFREGIEMMYRGFDQLMEHPPWRPPRPEEPTPAATPEPKAGKKRTKRAPS